MLDTHPAPPRLDSSNPTITVAIRGFTDERYEAMCEAIRSSLGQTRRPDEIVVVVDYNPPLLQRLRDEFADEPLVRLMPNERTQGVGGGTNTALIHARGDLICYLDDDAAAEPEWLERLTAHFDDPTVIATAGLAVPRWLDGDAPTWMPPEFNWVFGCNDPDQHTGVTEIRNVWGCSNALDRRAVLECGGFVETGLGRIGSHPIGGEDTEICFRLRDRYPGSSIRFDPDAVIHHRVPPARANAKYFFRRCWFEGVSKALLSRLWGSDTSLSEERRHAMFDIPRAVVRSLRHGRFAMAGALVGGLATTVAGYAFGRVNIALGRTEVPELRTEPLASAADLASDAATPIAG